MRKSKIITYIIGLISFLIIVKLYLTPATDFDGGPMMAYNFLFFYPLVFVSIILSIIVLFRLKYFGKEYLPKIPLFILILPSFVLTIMVLINFVRISNEPEILDLEIHNNTINPTGTYILDNDTIIKDGEIFSYTGKIQINLLSPNKIIMSFGIMKGSPSYNSGSFIDTLDYYSNLAIYSTPSDIDSSCRMIFIFSETDVNVTEKTDDYNFGCGFGHAVVADGRFLKVSTNKPELKDFLIDD